MTSDGGFDLNNLMEQAKAMQEQMAAAQEKQASTVVTGTSGGGKVAIEATGGGEFRNVTIAPDAIAADGGIDPDDVELLEELVLAALHDVAAQIAEAQNAALGGMDLPDLGNLGDLGGLGGLLGGDE